MKSKMKKKPRASRARTYVRMNPAVRAHFQKLADEVGVPAGSLIVALALLQSHDLRTHDVPSLSPESTERLRRLLA